MYSWNHIQFAYRRFEIWNYVTKTKLTKTYVSNKQSWPNA